MVATEKKVAFGSTEPRFKLPMTKHPGLDPQGIFKLKPKGCDPTLYHPQSMDTAYKKIGKPKKMGPWKYKTLLEDWSKNLGYRNQSILEQRKWYLSLLGPAWTEVPSTLKCEPAVCKNVTFGRTPRFKRTKFSTPGPGTYYHSKPFKAPYGPHSTRPTFEREEPCRFPDLTPKWSLAPNRYKILDKENIENKPKKIVSLRGPYDLFTGKRDGSTIKNHFSSSGKVYAKTWPLRFPGSLEGLKKKRTGVWNKTGFDKAPRNREAMTDLVSCPRKISDPGPGTYFQEEEYKFPQYKYGFNSSYDKPPGYKRTLVWPGVGRYNVARPRPCGLEGHGHKHVFLCKIPRTIGAVLPEPMNSF